MPGEIKHYWVGTTLMVESDAGVSGCDLKGRTGDIGPRGPQGPAGVVVGDGGDINIDLTGYATETYVDNAIANAELGGGDIDLTGYATTEYVNTVVNSNKPDLTNYATKSYVDSAVDNVDVDLTDYATKNYVSTEIAKAQLEGADVDLSGYATKDDIADMATKSYVQSAIGNSNGAAGASIAEYTDVFRGASNETSGNVGFTTGAEGSGATYYIKTVSVDEEEDIFSFTIPIAPTYGSDNDTGVEEITGTFSGSKYNYSYSVLYTYTYQYNANTNTYTGGNVRSIHVLLDPENYVAHFTAYYVSPIRPDIWGEDKAYTCLNPNVVPIDGETIQINDNGKLSAIAGGSVDLTNYATKTYVQEYVAENAETGGSVEVDGTTIIKNADGTISTAIGGGVSGKATEINGLNRIYREVLIYNDLDNRGLPGHVYGMAAGKTYTIQFTFTNGETDTFTITIPAYDASQGIETSAAITNSNYFSQFNTYYVEGQVYDIEDFTLKEDVSGDDLYITSIVVWNGSGTGYSTIIPQVIPVDGTTIQINGDGKLTAITGGSVDLTNYATKTYVDTAITNAKPTTETWTFTLADGSTVSKKVCLG